MLLASAGVLVGVWRVLSVVMAEWKLEDLRDGERAGKQGERWPRAVVVVLGVVVCVTTGLVPQLLAPMAARIAGCYTFLVP
jgi:hypothetical protein